MTQHDLNPGKLVELSSSYWKIFTLHAGVKIDVFTAIGKDELEGDVIAKKVKSDADGLTRLLNALCAMGLLTKKGDKFLNNEISLNFLSKESPKYIGYIIMHHYNLVESWHKLDLAVKTGKPVRTSSSHEISNEQRENFLMGMFNMAMSVAPNIVELFDFLDKKNFLDLGGGPGTYAINFCLKNPNLKASVYDLPTTRPFAEKTIQKFGLTDRISFIDGDYIKEEKIPGNYDVVWLSHILHGEGYKDCKKVIAKAVNTLKPGGIILIHEFILSNTLDCPLFPSLFSLNMLLGTESGRSYSEEELMCMLSDVGVKDIKRIKFNNPNESSIIKGNV